MDITPKIPDNRVKIDDTDFGIKQAIRDLGISMPNSDRINSLVIIILKN